jgi:hypothetical protein
MYNRAICEDTNVYSYEGCLKEGVYKKYNSYFKKTTRNDKCVPFYLGYNVQCRGIWIATFIWSILSIITLAIKFWGFHFVYLKADINYCLMLRHVPEKRNSLLAYRNIQNRDEFYVFRRLDLKPTLPGKELHINCLGYTVRLTTALGRESVMLSYFIKVWNYWYKFYKCD